MTHIPEAGRAEFLRNDHACAETDAVDEAHEQKDEIACAADGGESSVAEQVAYDEGVGGVVELLKEIAENQGHGEEGDGLPYGARSHGVLCRGHGRCNDN